MNIWLFDSSVAWLVIHFSSCFHWISHSNTLPLIRHDSAHFLNGLCFTNEVILSWNSEWLIFFQCPFKFQLLQAYRVDKLWKGTTQDLKHFLVPCLLRFTSCLYGMNTTCAAVLLTSQGLWHLTTPQCCIWFKG